MLLQYGNIIYFSWPCYAACILIKVYKSTILTSLWQILLQFYVEMLRF